MDAFLSTTHFHILTWVVGIVLFLAAAFMAKGSKGQTIVHMTARLFYVLILISGLFLFMKHSSYNPMLYGIKFLAGFVTIGMMEMVLVRSNKNKNVSVLWILFFVFLFVTLFLGFKLPVGINFLA